MERFKNILFASIGGKDDLAAVARANRLAITNQARLTLVRVIEELPIAASYFLSKKRLAEFKETSQHLAQKELDKLSQKIDPSLKVETKVLFGKPFIELIRMAVGHSHDLIIKPKHLTFKEGRLESVDLHLLRKSPCPVLIIKPNQRKPFGKILIAVDPDPSDTERFKLHQDLIKLGMSLAKRENSKLEVVHTWELDGESMLRGPRFKMSEEEIKALTEEVEKTHLKWMEDILSPYDSNNVKTTMAKGPSGATLVEMIEKKKPDIVVMGTVARSNLPGLLIGNTAESVLSRITCSLLTIKPPGFKTPVS